MARLSSLRAARPRTSFASRRLGSRRRLGNGASKRLGRLWTPTDGRRLVGRSSRSCADEVERRTGWILAVVSKAGPTANRPTACFAEAARKSSTSRQRRFSPRVPSRPWRGLSSNWRAKIARPVGSFRPRPSFPANEWGECSFAPQQHKWFRDHKSFPVGALLRDARAHAEESDDDA